MPSAFEYNNKVFRTSREMVEHFLRRGAELGASRLGPSHPAAAWLAAHKDAATEGGTIVLDGQLPLPADRAALAGILDEVGAEGLKADAFDGSGAAWVRGELSALARDLRGEAPKASGEAAAAAEPFPSRKLLVAYGLGSMVFSAVLLGADQTRLAEVVFGLGCGAFARAFWMTWGLDD